MLNFYPLGPTAFLNKLLGPTYPYHMVLAQHLYDDDFTPTDYFMYFRRRAALPGYHIILDNGVYEGKKVTYDYLLRATMELNPHVVILPDTPHQMGATLEGGEAFKALLKKYKWKGQTMTVVHAEPGNLEQFVHAYMEAAKQSRWIGISRLTEDFGCLGGDAVCRRANFLTELSRRRTYQVTHHHHALGMRDGSLEELKSLSDSNLVRSCDSSAPIWRGLHGIGMTSNGGFHTDFNPEGGWVNWNGGLDQSSQAETNLWEVEQACR